MFFIASCIEDARKKEFLQMVLLHFTMLVHALVHWVSWRSITLLKERFKTTTTTTKKTTSKKHTTHFKKMIMAHAGEGNYLSLCTESHQHIETEAFYGFRKLYFTSYLALCTILEIATLWKHLSASINCSWKKRSSQ